jgi:AraC-like DNA-binding protein
MGRTPAVRRIDWRPAGAYALAVEVLSFDHLRRKEAAAELGRPQSVQFFVLIGVTRGRAHHRIDFTSIDARPGTWILQHPGQLQQYDVRRDWDGWLIVFRPDLLAPVAPRQASARGTLDALIDALPTALHLGPAAHARCCDAAARMGADARRAGAQVDAANALLLHELGALLARLRLAAPAQRNTQPRAGDDDRVRRLTALVAAEPGARRPVQWYAERLHCSAKTLGRAVRAASGTPVKAWLDERVALEARRLLVHSAEPVKRVADRLGFADPANFIKFFKRVVGTTPLAFRGQQGR